jgi:hypothetical protein
VALSLNTFLKDGFILNLATFLENASRELPPDFAAHAFKAGATVFEYRNTPDPSLITSMLMAILQENGRRFSPRLLQKMVRDDVCWNKADRPWRRMPYWLVLRVSVQRYLAETLHGEVGRVDFKFLTIHLLANFLRDAQHREISIDDIALLKTKICRRLVKLDEDKQNSQDSLVGTRIEYLSEKLDPELKTAIEKATGYIEARWRMQQLEMARSIPILPRQASPGDLKMEMRASGNFLNAILQGFNRPRKVFSDQGPSFSFAEATKQHLNQFAKAHFDLIDLENNCIQACDDASDSSPDEVCKAMSKLISQYIRGGLPLYHDNPQQLSLMILTVMELWKEMDNAACQLFPLIRQFHPIFRPDMLDALLLAQYDEMERVQKVQLYIRQRIETCGYKAMNIFEDPANGCFGHRFYDESDSAPELQKLHDTIEAWTNSARRCKKDEWTQKSQEYEDQSIKIDKSKCVFLVDEDNPLGRGYHDPRCPRCTLIKQQSRIRIQAFENPLPSDRTIAKTVIFELACPATFALYRHTTWYLLSKLALPPQEEAHPPRCFLRAYQQLSKFANSVTSSLSLASTTKSCMLVTHCCLEEKTNVVIVLSTHYSWMTFPVEWDGGRDSVCRPNGLKLAYFDLQSKVWPARGRRSPSFLHHLKLEMPQSSPFYKLQEDPSFAEFTYGPSSYDVVATASRCPPGLNIHEYMAFQTIASGKSRRWITILTELGSANLNFSNEATTILLNHLALQCGPASNDDDPFRLIHSAFRDEAFGNQLLNQLSNHLSSLFVNWRESQLLNTVITLTLRLADLALAAELESVYLRAISLLVQARGISVRWFKALRVETYKTSDPVIAQRCQQYALWAALLCKKTFMFHAQQTITLDDLSLEIFIQSCITVQDNLVVKVDTLPKLLQQAIVNDFRLTHEMCSIVCDSINSRPHVFSAAIRDIWPAAEGCTRKLSNVRIAAHGWISCTAYSGEDTNEQQVYYNVAEGTLLVDNRRVGVSFDPIS